MADKDNTNNVTGEQDGANEQGATSMVPAKKGGIWTGVKVVAGVVIGTSLLGLGWLLRGVLGRDDDDDAPAENTETTTEG